MKEPGFVISLREEILSVDRIIKDRVNRSGGMSDNELISLVQRIEQDPAQCFPDHPSKRDVTFAETKLTQEDEELGHSLILEGKVAFVVIVNDGARLFAKLPSVGISLLGWKLLQAGNMPVWVMSSPSLTKSIQRHISSLVVPLGMKGTIFEQFEGYNLTPDNRLDMPALTFPTLHTLGSGDLGPALIESGVLVDFPEVKHVVVCNVDNIMASPHLGIIGHHANTSSTVTCEVVERNKHDRGGVLAWVENNLQIVEDRRLSSDFVEKSPFHDTGTMVIDVSVFARQIKWRWHRLRKQDGARLVVQHERLLQQYTEENKTKYVVVPREVRYLPVKTNEDIELADKIISGYEFKR